MVLKAIQFVWFILFACALAACGDQQITVSKDGSESDSPPLGPTCRPDSDVRPGQPKPYCGDLPSLAAVNVRNVVLDEVIRGLKYPWAFEFVNRNEVLITEFNGTMSRINTLTGKKQKISGLPEFKLGSSQRGLLDVALHPNFDENGLIYFSYAKHNDKDFHALAIIRAKLTGKQLEDVRELVVADPYIKPGSNFGGALVFDGTERLLIAVGDRSKRNQAQNPKSLLGKILRLNDDGSIPNDNPFLNEEDGIRDEIYAFGVRNPQGLVYDATTDQIYEAEHGPMGGDEVNVIKAGRNYGWPEITYGMNYTFKKIGVGTTAPGLEQPLFYYLPSRAVSPISIYRGTMFPDWNGDLLVGALKAQTISKIDIVDGRALSETPILAEINGRIRDIKTADDGSVWILSQKGSLFRLYKPEGVDQTTLTGIAGMRSGTQVYNTVCSSCHSQNAPGVPNIDDPDAWTDRLSKGKNALYTNTINGIGSMPSKGYCEDCTDAELKAAVDYMIERLNR
ncbi:MAG: PQQ-dependent sugar dehydrogenase [Pseudomonadota bacterium]